MVLLLITPMYPPQVGGAATYVSILCHEIATQDIISRLYILAPHCAGTPSRERPNGKALLLRLLAPWGSGSPVIRAIGLLWNLGVFFLLLPVLTHARRVDATVIHTRFAWVWGRWVNWPLFLLPLVCRGALIWDIRDRRTVPRYRGAFRGVLCASRNVHEEARRWWPTECCYLVGVPVRLPRVDNSQPDVVAKLRALCPYVAYIGDMHPYKGIVELVDAFRMVRTSHKCRLIMAGANYIGGAINQVLTRSQDVHYLGPVSHKVATIIMAHADLVILPSRSEGLPRTCLEALMLGKRVILPPGVPEFEEHCPKFVVRDITPQDIAAKIRAVLGSSAVPSYPLQQHDPAMVVERFLRSIDEVVSRSRKGRPIGGGCTTRINEP